MEQHLAETALASPECAEYLQPYFATDYGSQDYLRLPHHGRYHYSLEDAALIAACDRWVSGLIDGFPVSDDWPSDFDTPDVRKKLEPTQAAICGLLARAVEKRICDTAEVLGRDATTSAPMPSRTFITLHELVDCLELHGYPVGDVLLEKIHEESEAWQAQAEQIAEERAALRHAHLVSRRAENGTDFDAVKALRELVKDQELEIAHLKHQLFSDAPQRPTDKISTRERNTLLLIIAAACKFAGLDYKKAHKTATLLCSSAAELGVGLGDTTAEEHLKKIPAALKARSRPAGN